MRTYFLWGAQFLIAFFSLRLHDWAQTRLANHLGDFEINQHNWFSLREPLQIDWIGSVLLPLFLIWRGMPVFGWVKPITINSNRLHRPRLDAIMIALSGPLIHLLLGLAGCGVFLTLNALGLMSSGLLGLLLFSFSLINFSLAFFNLLPVPPLDGGEIVELFLSGDALTAWEEVKPYGFILLLAAIYFNTLSFISMPLTSLLMGIFGL